MRKKRIRCGDIYLAEIVQSIGHEYKKLRPFLVVDSDRHLNGNNVVCTVPLTSNLTGKGFFDVYIEADYFNHLSKNSIARLNHLNAFDRDRLKHRIGFLKIDKMKLIHARLREKFNL